MIADVAHVSRAKQGIAYCMKKDIGIAVTKKSFLMLKFYSTNPEFTVLNQFVNVKTKSNAYFHNSIC